MYVLNFRVLVVFTFGCNQGFKWQLWFWFHCDPIHCGKLEQMRPGWSLAVAVSPRSLLILREIGTNAADAVAVLTQSLILGLMQSPKIWTMWLHRPLVVAVLFQSLIYWGKCSHPKSLVVVAKISVAGLLLKPRS